MDQLAHCKCFQLVLIEISTLISQLSLLHRRDCCHRAYSDGYRQVPFLSDLMKDQECMIDRNIDKQDVGADFV